MILTVFMLHHSLFAEGKEPPPVGLASAPYLPFKVNLHGAVRSRDNFIPVLSDILLPASVATGACFLPTAPNRHNVNVSVSPDEFSRKAGFTGRHARTVERRDDRLEYFADECFFHRWDPVSRTGRLRIAGFPDASSRLHLLFFQGTFLIRRHPPPKAPLYRGGRGCQLWMRSRGEGLDVGGLITGKRERRIPRGSPRSGGPDRTVR